MQVKQPVGTRPSFTAGDAIVVMGLAALLYLGITLATGVPQSVTGPQISLDPLALPYYALRSVLRMAGAYVLSLLFTLVYSYVAARNRRAEAVLIPILDVLQSVPILSFLPVVVLALVALFPGGAGLELAAIVLIFTSQAWNMAFAFYYSLITVPKEMMEAADVFRLSRWQRFKSVEVPFSVIGLVWNSMMSWAGGWFFLMAAEQFVLGDKNFQLPGLGSYLKTAAEAGNISALLMGLLALVIVIVALDQFVWRPVIAWSDKFKLQTVTEAEPPRSWMLDLLSRSVLLERFRRLFPAGRLEGIAGPLRRTRREAARRRGGRGHAIARGLGMVALGIVAIVLVYGGARAINVVFSLSLDQWLLILGSSVATLSRVVASLIIALAWTLPAGVAIGTNPRLGRRLLPVVQVVASVPATALFPVLLLLLIGLTGGVDFAALLLMLLGTQWYVLFNVIAGAMSIPEDLKYTTASLGITGLERWRSFILPAIFPYLVTGMITASGGAWNASIVSEYVQFAGRTYQTLGLGALIAGSSESADFTMLLVSTLAMVTIVVVINRLFWRRLSRQAESRFHLD